MQGSKKAIVVSVIFVVVVSILASLVIVPYVYFNPDRLLRKSLEGRIDYVIVGASHGQCAFIPEILDQEMGCYSYNLCGSLMTFHGRQAILEEAFEKNPIKTVVIEIAYNTLQRDSKETEGDLTVIPRLSGIRKQASYFFHNIRLTGLDMVYGFYFKDGALTLRDLMRTAVHCIGSKHFLQDLEEGTYAAQGDSVRGYFKRGTESAALTPEDAIASYNTLSFDRNYNDENLAVLSDIVNDCKKRGAEVLFVVTPLAGSCLWKNKDLDVFYRDAQELAASNHCALYDFNLLKSRFDLFDDATSFWGDAHLCYEGAQIFSREYGQIMKRLGEGEDVSDLFYDSYEEMKQDLPYWAYMSQQG